MLLLNHRVWPALPAATLILVVIGCSSGSRRAAVHGQVNLNGTPVEKATITFFALEGNGPAAGGAIENGSYTIPSALGPLVGRNKVDIRGLPKKTGKKIPMVGPGIPPGSKTDEIVEAIPARYNSATELEVDLREGDNRQDFNLKSP